MAASGSSTGVIYLNSPVPAFGSASQASAVSSQTQTPQAPEKIASGRPRQTHERNTRNNPRTPLDSLLTAARSISMIEEDADAEDDLDEPVPGPSSQPLTRTRGMEPPESPLPAKRKRTVRSAASASQKSANTTNGEEDARAKGGPARMRSALDVLADQAAVFMSKEKDTGRGRGKGKGKARAADADADDAEKDTDTMEQEQEPEAASESVPPRSRTRSGRWTGTAPQSAARDTAREVAPEATPAHPSRSSPARGAPEGASSGEGPPTSTLEEAQESADAQAVQSDPSNGILPPTDDPVPVDKGEAPANTMQVLEESARAEPHPGAEAVAACSA